MCYLNQTVVRTRFVTNQLPLIHDDVIETHSPLLALCEGNPQVIDEFLPERTSNVELSCFL